MRFRQFSSVSLFTKDYALKGLIFGTQPRRGLVSLDDAVGKTGSRQHNIQQANRT